MHEACEDDEVGLGVEDEVGKEEVVVFSGLGWVGFEVGLQD